MKKLSFYIIFCLSLILSACSFAPAQNTNLLKAKCPSPSRLYQTFALSSNGDMNATLCAGGTFNIDGTPIPTGGGTTNRLTYWTSASTLGSTPISWNGTVYTFQNTALNSEFTMLFTPNNSAGDFTVGDFATTPTNYIKLNQASSIAIMSAQMVQAGDINSQVNGTKLVIDDAAQTFTVNNSANSSNLEFDIGNHTFTLNTITNVSNVSFDLINRNFTLNSGSGVTVIGDVNSQANDTLFALNDNSETVTVTANEFQISDSFAIRGGSTCAGSGTVGAGGTVTVAAPCVGSGSRILLTYTSATARTIPLTVTAKVNITSFSVSGDANQTFDYLIVNSY